jgi:hypothetical protein
MHGHLDWAGYDHPVTETQRRFSLPFCRGSLPEVFPFTVLQLFLKRWRTIEQYTIETGGKQGEGYLFTERVGGLMNRRILYANLSWASNSVRPRRLFLSIERDRKRSWRRRVLPPFPLAVY